ncbi:MAG TPA: hypothetical protein VNV43_02420, partial [Candidatus Acidoferrales bacterium]|nr:hypothetical protein [Candidatus Acidoferrales bacterium]
MTPETNIESQVTPGRIGLNGRKNLQIFAFEIFVALALAVAFFYLVKPCFISGDAMNRYAFTSGSKHLFRLDQQLMGTLWNARLGGLLLTGALTDYSLDRDKDNGADTKQGLERMSDAFAAYHAFWLILIFILVIFAFQDSLLINLGVFGGLMYDFSPISGPYFYPWDMPVMFFASMAALLFERKRHWLMVAVICVGSLFKETSLVCALLVLFAVEWKREKRIAVFVGIIVAYFISARLLLKGLALPPMYPGGLSVLSAHGLPRALALGNLTDNVKALFAPDLNSALFVNAGTLLAVLVLCWRRRYLPYMTVIAVYVVMMFFMAPAPGIDEVRDFMQILPLSVILLSDWRMRLFQPGEPADTPPPGGAKWMTRGTVSLLPPMVLALICACVGVITWRYYVTAKNANAYTQQLELARVAVKSGDLAGAVDHEEQALALNPNSIEALNNVAWLRATAPDAALRNGD